MIRAKPYRGSTGRGARRVLTIFVMLLLAGILAFAALLGVGRAGRPAEV